MPPPVARDPQRYGGAERYAAWLRGALQASGLLDAQAPTLAIKARSGGPLLRCADGVSAAWVARCGRSRLRWWRHVVRERRAIRRADRVIAIAPLIANELAAWYGRRDAAVVLNPLLASPAPPAPRRAGAVFVGHGFHRKGLDRALAVTSLDLPLTVVGAGRGPALPWVRYVGAVDARPYIAGAALLIHPARYEPYGNVVAEAVAAQIPAVVSDATGAACLLHPDHVWAEASGEIGLRRVVERVLRDPRPPVRQPPSADAHLDALFAALFGAHA